MGVGGLIIVEQKVRGARLVGLGSGDTRDPKSERSSDAEKRFRLGLLTWGRLGIAYKMVVVKTEYERVKIHKESLLLSSRNLTSIFSRLSISNVFLLSHARHTRFTNSAKH